MTKYAQWFPGRENVLMVYRSPNANHAGERVQLFLWDQTQQGQTYVPGVESFKSRGERVKGMIRGVEEHFPSSPSVQMRTQRGQAGAPSAENADLNGVGQQF